MIDINQTKTQTVKEFCQELCRVGVTPMQLLVYSEYKEAYEDFRFLGKSHKEAIISTMQKCKISRPTVYRGLQVFGRST